MRGPVTPNQLSAAYHESGHAVIAAVEGIEVLAVSIDVHIDDSVDGHCRTWRTIFSPSELQLPETERRKLKLEKLSRMILAGGWAARRFRVLSQNLLISPGDDHDHREAVKITTELATLTDASQWSVYSSLHVQMADLVEKHWRIIDRLAQELLWRRSMSRDQLRRVYFPNANPEWSEQWWIALGSKNSRAKQAGRLNSGDEDRWRPF
jgi:hypothetical protein